MNNFFEKLTMAAGEGCVTAGEPMKKHVTFRVGGPASYFVSPSNEESLKNTLLVCIESGLPYYILGNGSNLLISDEGYDGVIIFLGGGFSEITQMGQTVRAGAGALLSKIASCALKNSLTGFEFAAGIPGSLGGAIVMNAGAYDGEMKHVLTSARVMTVEGAVKVLDANELKLSYRHSSIQEMGYIVLSAEIELHSGDQEIIQGRMEELAAMRKEKQPLEYPSAGSTFKRPEGYFAGKLIQDAGLRGYRVGGAQVSEKHCGFVINKDQATAADIRKLCQDVQEKVKETSGVELETEVRMLGFK